MSPLPAKITTPSRWCIPCFGWLLPALLLVASLSGCSQNKKISQRSFRQHQIAKWIHHLESPSTSYPSILRTDRRLQRAIGPVAPARLAALTCDIAGNGQSSRIKIYCIKQLWHSDRSFAADLIVERIPFTDRWPVLQTEIHLALQVKSPSERRRIAASLIKSLARKSHRYKVAQRPEAVALRMLLHAHLSTILIRALTGDKSIATRIAAMHVLEKWRGRSAMVRYLQTCHEADPFMRNLRRYACDFFFAPRTATQLLWIQQSCRMNPTGAFAADRTILHRIGRWQSAVSPLQLFWLSHLTIPTNGRLPTPTQLCRNIIATGKRHQHIKRPPWYAGAPDDVHSAVNHSVPRLEYLDLCMLSFLQHALAAPSFDRQIWVRGRHAAHSRLAEPGGLIVAGAPGSMQPLPYLQLSLPHLLFIPSAANRGTGIYVSGAAIIRQSPQAVSAFIYHFQQTDNARYCGPAIGDLQYARHNAAVVVIFTSIARRQFDATVDFPSGVVVDLGVYRVPPATVRPN